MSDLRSRRHMRTKIIATLGPASSTRDRLEEMCDVGLDVCRLNFSHGELEGHERTLELVRSIAADRGSPMAVIGDLCGPKIRLGVFRDEPVELEPGQTVRMTRGDGECTARHLTTSYPALIDEVDVGQRIYIDDGLVRLVVTDRGPDELTCQCTTGGALSSRKGVNLPDTPLSTPTLTEKDHRDLNWAIDHDLDYVALSFVREPEDLYELKRLIKARGSSIHVIIKIEKQQALWHLEELVAHTDAVLVARGDLGVETDIWGVPLIQKDIVAHCRSVGVPVIVATQMLQSMIESPMPTRAEVSDVANAIIDRSDAVMLSGETAIGRFPVQSVDMMNRVAVSTEEYLLKHPPMEIVANAAPKHRPTAAVAHAAVAAAKDLGARLVAVWSATGATVRMVAQHRLPMPVAGLSYDPRVCRQMSLLFGVIPIRVEPMDNPAAMAVALDGILLDRKLVVPGDIVVVVTSTRPTAPGGTDSTVVRRIEAPPER